MTLEMFYFCSQEPSIHLPVPKTNQWTLLATVKRGEKIIRSFKASAFCNHAYTVQPREKAKERKYVCVHWGGVGDNDTLSWTKYYSLHPNLQLNSGETSLDATDFSTALGQT